MSPGAHYLIIILTVLWAYGGGLDICLNGPGLFTIASSLQQDVHTFVTQAFYWRPLANYVSRILYAGFGLNPVPYHIFDLIIHSLNALLVYHIATKLSKDGVVALMAGLMFAAFHRHAELLFSGGLFYEHGYAFFCLLSIATFLHFQDTNRIGYLAVSLASIFVALLLKESAIVAFPLIVALDQFYRPHSLPRIRWKLILSLVGIGVVYLAIRMHFVPSPGGGIPVWLTPIRDWGVVNMLKQMNMALYLTISDVCPWRDIRSVFYLGFILFIWKATRHRRLAVTATTLVIISVLPLLCSFGLLDRYVYFPSAFSVIFLATVIRYSTSALADRIIPSHTHAGANLVAGAVLLLIVAVNVYKLHDLEVLYREAGSLLRSNIEDIITALPNGTKDFRLYLINNPMILPRAHDGIREHAHYFRTRSPRVWADPFQKVNWVLQLFYEKPDSIGEVRELTANLGYPISEDRKKISHEELDSISKDPKSQIFVFNPHTRHLEDKTGKTSQEIRMAIETSAIHLR